MLSRLYFLGRIIKLEKSGVFTLRKYRLSTVFYKCSGVILAVAGIGLVVSALPLCLWPLLLGMFLIWMGWRFYTAL